MHIAIDATPWDNERGFGRFTRSLVSALAARDTGFRYTLLFAQDPKRAVPDNVEIVVAGAKQGLGAASSGAAARKSADIWSVMKAARTIKADAFFFPAVYSYFPVFSRIPKIMCFHDTIPERFPDLIFPTKRNFRLWQIKMKLAALQASRVMTISEASAVDLAKILRIPKSKIDVIVEGPEDIFRTLPKSHDFSVLKRDIGWHQGDRTLVYVGGFNRHKNVISLIRALPRILAGEPKARLVIVGRMSGERFWDNVDELQQGAADLGQARSRVHFAGELSDQQLIELLNLADALVFPSLWEGFGLPAVEAMACGTPVLASDRGSLPEVIGDAGLLFDPLDPGDIAETTLRLLQTPGLAAELTKKAESRVKSFAWDKGAALAEASFRQVLP